MEAALDGMITYFGEPSQADKLAEELFELSIACGKLGQTVLKFKYQHLEAPTHEVITQKTVDNLAGESADVLLMIDQMERIVDGHANSRFRFGDMIDRAYRRKLERTADMVGVNLYAEVSQ
jgi:hypothetical protein